MTLCNVCLTRDRVVMLTDTVSGQDRQPLAFTTKFSLLAHITAVISARGPDDFDHETRLFLDHSYLPAGVETAVDLLPAFLRDLEARILPARYGTTDLFGEVIMVGWAPGRGRFAGWNFHHSNAYAPRELELDHVHYLPAGSDYKPIARVDFGAKLIALAKEQYKVMRAETRPGYCCTVGGDLIAVDMTTSGTTVRKVARLDGYQEIKDQLAWRLKTSTPSAA